MRGNVRRGDHLADGEYIILRILEQARHSLVVGGRFGYKQNLVNVRLHFRAVRLAAIPCSINARLLSPLRLASRTLGRVWIPPQSVFLACDFSQPDHLRRIGDIRLATTGQSIA